MAQKRKLSRTEKKKPAEKAGFAACRKGVHLEKMQFYTLRRLREIELNFVFLRAGAVQRYCPRAKNGKRNAA